MGSHYNRAWTLHSVFSEALERLLLERFLNESGVKIPVGSISKNFHVNASYDSGISVMILMQAIQSTIYAATDFFIGRLSLGCSSGNFHLSLIISISLLFAVTLREPSAFAKLSGTAHRGYRKACSKFTTLLALVEIANNVPNTSLVTSIF